MQLDALAERYRAGEEQKDRRAALVCYTMAKLWAKNPGRIRLDDFMPRRRPLRPLTDDQLRKQLDMSMMALGGKKKDG